MSQETQQETASANRPIGKITQIAAAVGRAARQPAGGSVGAVLALLIGFFALGAFMGAALVSDKESVPATIGQQTAVAPAASTPEPSSKEAWTSPFRQVTGFDSPDGKSYACADGLTPVQMTVGQVYKRGDTVLTLGEDVSKSTPLYPAAQQVKLTVKLGAGDALPGYIVQPASQANFPTLYNQATFIASLGRGGEATYTLSADILRYTRGGGDKIAGVIACLK